MIVILGDKGLLGSAVKRHAKNFGMEFFGLNRSNCDFRDFSVLLKTLKKINPRVVINCAAVISIETCEIDPRGTKLINETLPNRLAEYLAISGGKLLHISTDHLFEQKGSAVRHNEVAQVHAVNTYAKQKVAAEKKIIESGCDHWIIRTNLLGFKPHRSTLLQWIINRVKSEPEIIGFSDSYISALDVPTLSDIILRYMHTLSGTYNVASTDVYSKFELIENVIKRTRANCRLIEGSANSLSVPRCNSGGLDTQKFVRETSFDLPNLQQSLDVLGL